jgi:hypothetical protein
MRVRLCVCFFEVHLRLVRKIEFVEERRGGSIRRDFEMERCVSQRWPSGQHEGHHEIKLFTRFDIHESSFHLFNVWTYDREKAQDGVLFMLVGF